MMRGKPSLSFLTFLLVACTNGGGSNEEVAEEESTDGSEDPDADAGTSTDEIGEDDLGSDDGSDDGTEGGSGCEGLTGTATHPNRELIDWGEASGRINHWANQGVADPQQIASAVFATGTGSDESLLCVEWLAGDDDIEIDSCNVYYTLGFGTGYWPDAGFQQPEVESITFDAGEGPVALEIMPGDNITPTSHRAWLTPPPEGVPFGGTATMAVSFTDLPALEVELDVPDDSLPITPALDSTALSSAELSSWTWSNPGGAEPMLLEIHVRLPGAPTSEAVYINCRATDDGEFAFPSEYFDLAREKLGPEIEAFVHLTRRTRGEVPHAGESVFWTSTYDLMILAAVVD